MVLYQSRSELYRLFAHYGWIYSEQHHQQGYAYKNKRIFTPSKVVETIIIWTPDLPQGYGVFDQEEIIEEVEIITNNEDDECRN